MSFLLQVVRITIPYALAALGGALSERGGVINIALEGTLLVGAFGGAVGAYYTHNALLGLLCGIGAGAALQLVHGLACVRWKADQIVSGLAANLLALGATRFFLKLCFDSTANSPRIAAWRTGAPFLIMALAAAFLAHGLLYGTRFGLRLRACGEHPEAARTLGVQVARVRLAAVALAGALAGLGGVWLAFDQHKFVDNMSAGRGYVALAAMIFGKWRPLPACAACLLFGLAEAAQIGLQASGIGLPTQLVQMLPYLMTILALTGGGGRARGPAALGTPYEAE
ncbi:MAG TPA: ABC transporter permease [Polyangia bacterium]|nr:ABC transporter permease [Polyangia bacterium]